MDPANVPMPVHPLLPIVQKWGACCSDSERYAVAAFAERDDDRIAELEASLNLWTDELTKAYFEWYESTSLTDSYELSKFYFFTMMLDQLEIRFPSTGKPTPISELIADLKTMDGIANVAKRMWAARYLGERGEEAREAIPALETATKDDSVQVRAWAQAALALITGDVESRRDIIRTILANLDEESNDRIWVESALEELDKPQVDRDILRLTGAAITNDLETIRKLLPKVGANGVDPHGSTAIDLAVGNNQLEAARLLLQAGADPNRSNRFDGTSLLHIAARKRTGAPMVELLLSFGADPTRKNRKGRRPLHVAREYRRRHTIAILEAAQKGARRA